jgi:hypothetical protein
MRRRTNKDQEGFVLLFVLVLLIAMLSLGMVVLRETGERVKEGAAIRNQASVGSALHAGLDRAVSEIRSLDPAQLAHAQWDIFDPSGNAAPLIPAVNYPDKPISGQDVVEVQVGFRTVARTRPPPGEDVRHTHGYLAEVLLSVENTRAGLLRTSSEERVAVGVQIPHRRSHSGR